jgi:uncharacterized protein
MPFVAAIIAGILFGAGLTVSGMSNPKKVLDFLDIAAIARGGWDPTLIMVFCGALPVMFAAYRLQGRKPLFADAFSIPAGGAIDRPLVVGSALFGIGWGLVGLCPGPAMIAPALASRAVLGPTLVFLASLLLGVWLAVMTRALWRGSDEPVAV